MLRRSSRRLVATTRRPPVPFVRHTPPPVQSGDGSPLATRLVERSARSRIPRSPRVSATLPVRASSTIPKSESSSSNATTLSGAPVASIVSVWCVTSRTRTRNTSAISMIRALASPSARTLISASSRSIEPPASCSRILITLMSLLSCFVTCSRGLDSTSTTIVIRESPLPRSVRPRATRCCSRARRTVPRRA